MKQRMVGWALFVGVVALLAAGAALTAPTGWGTLVEALNAAALGTLAVWFWMAQPPWRLQCAAGVAIPWVFASGAISSAHRAMERDNWWWMVMAFTYAAGFAWCVQSWVIAVRTSRAARRWEMQEPSW